VGSEPTGIFSGFSFPHTYRHHPTQWARNHKPCQKLSCSSIKKSLYPTQWAWNELGNAWRHEHYICVVSIPHGGLRTSGLLVRLSFGLMRLHPTQWARNRNERGS